mgnify:CR=1 FL=1
MISISIIIPIYNVEQYVQRCLESVISQDYADSCVECIIVDDCTPDRSMDIVRQIVRGYHGTLCFRLLEHKENRGLSIARNTGLVHATGDYIFFIDSDDYLLPDSFRYFLRGLKEYPEVDMIMGNVRNCKYGDTLIGNIHVPCYINDCNVFVPRMLRHQIYHYAWNKLIRRIILMDNNVRFLEGILYEDQCWSYELSSYVSSVLILPQVTYIYENNPSSIVNTVLTQDRVYLVLKSYTISANKMLDNPPDLDRYSKNIMVDYFLYIMNSLMKGVDLLYRFNISADIANDFRTVRIKYFTRVLKCGRLFLSVFLVLLFPPLSHLQRIRLFRKNYYYIEAMVNRICHVTDFLHSKKRL